MQEGSNSNGNIYQFPENLPQEPEEDLYPDDDETPGTEEDIQSSADNHPSGRNRPGRNRQ